MTGSMTSAETMQHAPASGARGSCLYDRLGAHAGEEGGLSGVHFAVWAPNASSVAVVGDFNGWDGNRHRCASVPTSGVWELFVPAVSEGALYKYEVRSGDGTLLPQKADPVGFGAELRPSTASVVRDTTSLCLVRRRLDGAARDAGPAPRSAVDLRSASRVVATCRRWPTA